jgi:hypothetical protein
MDEKRVVKEGQNERGWLGRGILHIEIKWSLYAKGNVNHLLRRRGPECAMLTTR